MASDGAVRTSLQPGETNPAFVYLDSNIYLDYLIGDKPWQEALDSIVEAWQLGEVRVATSALTIAEVLHLRSADGERRRRLAPEEEPRVTDLFRPVAPRQFVLVEVTRAVAERARELVWDLGIEPKDAIHVASALGAGAPAMFTSDARLVERGAGGHPALRIERPHWTTQTSLPWSGAAEGASD